MQQFNQEIYWHLSATQRLQSVVVPFHIVVGTHTLAIDRPELRLPHAVFLDPDALYVVYELDEGWWCSFSFSVIPFGETIARRPASSGRHILGVLCQGRWRSVLPATSPSNSPYGSLLLWVLMAGDVGLQQGLLYNLKYDDQTSGHTRVAAVWRFHPSAQKHVFQEVEWRAVSQRRKY